VINFIAVRLLHFLAGIGIFVVEKMLPRLRSATWVTRKYIV